MVPTYEINIGQLIHSLKCRNVFNYVSDWRSLLRELHSLRSRVENEQVDSADLAETVRKKQVEAGKQAVIANLRRLGF